MKKKYVTITEYAKLCGVSRAAIYYRIEAGTIKADIINGKTGCGMSINIIEYPPVKLKQGRPAFSL